MSRIGFIGNFAVRSSRGEIVTTESYVAHALTTLRREVVEYQENLVDWSTLAARLEADDCPLVFWTRTPSFGCDTKSQAMFVDDAHARGIVTCGLHLDRYWDLARESDIYRQPWFRQTHVMTADGGNQDRFEAAGVNHRWWKPAVSATQVGAGSFTDEYACDVAFVGSERYHPEWQWRQILLRRLNRAYGPRFRQFGRSGARLEDHQLADAYASIKVVVGDSCLADQSSFYWSNRVVETLGRGGFLLHPYIEGMDDYYVDGEHLVYYQAGRQAELVRLIEEWLERDEDRALIMKAGMERVAEADTFEVRMAEVLAYLYDEHSHLRPYRDVLEAHARPGSTDAVVIAEQFEHDVYRIGRADLRDSVVVDVGANIGAFALHAAERGARVVAVEPDAGNVAVLRSVIAAAGAADVNVVQAAVAAERGRGRVVGAGATAQWTPADDGRIASFPLDDLIPDDVAILKLDVEGAEYDVVAVAERLAECERIEIEWHGEQMAPGADGRRVSELVLKLLETHVVEVYGLPEVGGAIHAVRRG